MANMDALLKALDANYEGFDEIRNLVVVEGPKYGNDDDSVDSIARQIGRSYCLEVEKYRHPRNGIYQPGLYPVSVNVPLLERPSVPLLMEEKRERGARGRRFSFAWLRSQRSYCGTKVSG